MKKRRLQISLSLKRLKVVPWKHWVTISVCFLLACYSFIFVFFRQYETVENTDCVVGRISNLRRVESFSTRRTSVILVFEMNGETYRIFYPTNWQRQYKQAMEFDFDTSDDPVELLVSRQSGENRVVDFRCGEYVFYSINTANKCILEDKIGAFITGTLMTIMWLLFGFWVQVSYKVVKFRRIKK